MPIEHKQGKKSTEITRSLERKTTNEDESFKVYKKKNGKEKGKVSDSMKFRILSKDLNFLFFIIIFLF